MTTGNDSLLSACRQRYPILDQIVVVDERGVAEVAPSFISLIFAILESKLKEPLCILLPVKGELPRIAATLFATYLFLRSYPDRLKQIAEQSFELDALVRVRPRGAVFQYRGVWPEFPDFFKLRTLPRKGHTTVDRTLPLSDILRLESTCQTTPRGGGESFSETPRIPIDDLLGITTHGNMSIFFNAVLVADAKEQFIQFATATHLSGRNNRNDLAKEIRDVIPIGYLSIGENDEFDLLHFNVGVTGHSPLLAVAHSLQGVSAYCQSSPHASPLLIVNGVSRATDLQAFDDVTSRLRTVVFAEHSEEESLRHLLDRGCRLWTLDAHTIDSNSREPHAVSRGMFGSVLRHAANAAACSFSSVECCCPELESAVEQLATLRPELLGDSQGPFARLLKMAWGIANRFAGLVSAPSAKALEHLQHRMRSAAVALQRDAVWVPRDVSGKFSAFLKTLTSVAQVGTAIGSDKGRALEQLLRDQPNLATLVVTHGDQLETVSALISSTGASKCTVGTPRSMPPGMFFDRIVCASWLGSRLMKDIAVAYNAATVVLLAYDFESRWQRQFVRHWQRMRFGTELAHDQKQQLITEVLGSSTVWNEEQLEAPSDYKAEDHWPSAIAIEQLIQNVRKGRPAPPVALVDAISVRYVGFVGNAYAYLSSGHRIPVATQLVRKSHSRVDELPEKTVIDLRTGDFVVFPASGDRELLHELADKLLGAQAPVLRARAARWRTALKASGLSAAQFKQRASELQESRHILTIRNWYADPHQIGPKSRNDIALIVLVTEDKQLDSDADLIWESIVQLRSAHLSAGMRLRDVLIRNIPTVTTKIEDHGTEVHLDELGSAWIVQVEAIADTEELRARTEINRLLWDSEVTDA